MSTKSAPALPTSKLVTKPQRESILLSVKRALGLARPPLPLRCSEWARNHFWLSAESSGSGTEGRFRPWPTQVAILDCMGNDAIQRVSIRKSAGIGYTKMLTAALGYFHHHKKRNTLTYQPTDEDAREFCKDTIDPMNRDVAVMGELLRSSGRNNKENTLQTKHYLGSVLHVRGGTSPNNYRRLRKDVVVYDELDGFDSDVDGEGDPVSLGDKRVRDSAYPKSIRGTTPTVHGQSLIQKSEADAAHSFRFKVPCPECGHMQHFEWGGTEVDHGIKWEGTDPESAHYVCIACAAVWDYSELPELLAAGQWRTEDGYWIDAESNLHDPEGAEIDYPQHVGFVIWSAYSLTFPWPVMVREFIGAKDDPVLLKTFVNTTLGEYWKETLTEVEADPLYARRESYRAPPAQTRCITFGADVQVDRIELEFVAWGLGEESWGIGYLILPGDTQKPPVWEALGREIQRTFTTVDGRRIRPKIGCVDSGYLPDQVYQFSRKHGVRYAIPIKGASTSGKPIATMPRRMNRETRVYLTEVGTDTAKETTYRRLLIEEPGRGYCHFPDSDDYDEEYFRQLTGEEKRPVRRQGRMVMAFQQAYSSVEVLDIRVYNLAAIKLAQQRFRVKLDEPVQPPAPRDPTPRDEEATRPQTKPPERRWINRRGSWMK